MAPNNIPEIYLSSGDPKKMPILGLGTATSQRPASPEVVIKAVVDAIELGYRHFDTASVYGTESALGEAISQTLNLGLIKSRDELFITSKLWCPDAHPDHVIPALKRTLKNLKLEYLDLYLVHWLVSMKPGSNDYPPRPENLLPMDIKSVWTDMEKCQTLGLTKFIGVSNFSIKKLRHLLAFANIPPVINQVEMNPVWQQRELHAFCKANGILIVAYSPLGGAGTSWGSNRVMESEVLKKIAQARGKSVAQVALRWVYEQGVVVVVKSFNKERLKQNLAFFDWELSTQEAENIANNIPQFRALTGEHFLSADGPIRLVEELWDEDD